jgi:hypothetical protein
MIERPHDGFEYPVHDIQVREGAEFCVGVVSPDYYAADVQQDGTLRATLLRSPVFAHQDPFSIPAASPYPISSQGEHSYSAALMLTDGYDFDMLLDEAERQNRPPWFSECTTGMPPR